MDNSQEAKKCFCARCFLPIDSEDKVDIEGQNFHRICSMCCICRTIPTSLKMFYGHVFCSDCFKSHVMARFKDEQPRVTSNSWWMQWGPGSKPQTSEEKGKEDTTSKSKEQPVKRHICARCLQSVDESQRVTIGDQSFHGQCAKCYFCHKIPSSNLKIYYGQVFCEDCFHKHVLNRNQDNPSEFFKNCFEQWQNNAQFAENMRDFLAGNKESAPFIFMMQGQQPPFCRCGTGPQEWQQPNEPKKSASCMSSIEDDVLELSFENRTDMDVQSINESANKKKISETAEKIEKLTKYLHLRVENNLDIDKSWKLLGQNLQTNPQYGWNELQVQKCDKLNMCPKCLWQSGPIYVNKDISRNKLSSEKNILNKM